MKSSPKVILPDAPATPPEPPKSSIRDTISVIGAAQVGLFLLAAVYATYHAKPVLLPLVLALLVAMVLKPVHRLIVRMGVPAALASGIVVICLLLGVFAVSSQLANPAAEWVDTIDMETAEARFREVFAPINEAQRDLEEVVEKVDRMTGGNGAAAPATSGENAVEDNVAGAEGKGENPARMPATMEEVARPAADSAEGAYEVGRGSAGDGDQPGSPDLAVGNAAGEESAVGVSDQRGGQGEPEAESEAQTAPVSVEISDRPVNVVYEYMRDFGVHAVATLLLIFFFLAFGDTMNQRISEDDATAELVGHVSRDVSGYLFTISAINAGLGFFVGLAMWMLGMPNPVLWGLMAAVLNYVPYLGAIVGSAIVFVVAMVSLQEVGMSFVVPAVYFGLTTIEGNIITPMIIGKRFTLNPIVVAVWFLSWGALWGIPGMLIATPTLMAFKIVCANVPGLARIDRVISV
jgi:predicted PurR-regulated permease PerM